MAASTRSNPSPTKPSGPTGRSTRAGHNRRASLVQSAILSDPERSERGVEGPPFAFCESGAAAGVGAPCTSHLGTGDSTNLKPVGFSFSQLPLAPSISPLYAKWVGDHKINPLQGRVSAVRPPQILCWKSRFSLHGGWIFKAWGSIPPMILGRAVCSAARPVGSSSG